MAEIVPQRGYGGLDLVTPENEGSPLRARSVKNVQKRRSGALRRRQGYKALATNTGNNGGFGTAIYIKRNTTTGAATKEKLSVGSKLFKITSHSLSVAYTGAGQAVMEHLVEGGEWHFKLYVDSVEVLDYNCGVGYDEASIDTVSQLATAIDALADFTSSAATGGSLPAAFIPYIAPTLVGNPSTVTFYESTAVNQPTTAADPFAQLFVNRNSSEFENASSFQMNDVIYFFSKWDFPKKYDGSDIYRAGCPQAGTPSTVEAASGALANGTYKHIATIVQIDAQNNEVEGIESLSDTVTTVGGFGINVTLSNVLAATGFNTDCAVVAGAQIGVNTITVDDGSGGANTMKVGQKAYFFDSISAGYVTRNITARNATTITVDGAAVTVADNAVISNNLRIRIYRTVTTGSIYKFVADIPNNSFTATQVYLDATSDANLGYEYESPAEVGLEHGLPPMCGYGAIYDGVPVLAGEIANPDTFYWASPDGPEYFPSLFSDYVQSENNYAITGISRGDRFFWIHKNDESFFVSGKLATGQYTVTQKGDAVGCLAHDTIQASDRTLIWLGDGGVFASTDGSVPVRISDDIAPVFDNAGLPTDRKLMFKRATAVYDRKHEIYILFLPTETSQGGEVYATGDSRTLVYDTKRGEWWEWTNLNMAGGISLDDMDVVWTERRYSTFNSTMAFQIYQRLNTNTSADYVDHVVDIPWEYMPLGWVDLGQPSINKKFLYAVIWALDPERNPDYALTINIEKNFIASVYQTVLTQTFGAGGGSGWGFGAWGFFAWGNPATNNIKKRRLRHGFSEAIRPNYSASGIYSEIVFGGIDLEVEAPFRIDINEARG